MHFRSAFPAAPASSDVLTGPGAAFRAIAREGIMEGGEPVRVEMRGNDISP